MEKNLKKNLYVWLNHFVVHLKLTQHCKSAVLQLKFKNVSTRWKEVRKAKGQHSQASFLQSIQQLFPQTVSKITESGEDANDT